MLSAQCIYVLHVILRTDSDYSHKQRLTGMECVLGEVGTEPLGSFTELQKIDCPSCVSARPSARPHVTAWLPLDGFSLNLMFEYLAKIQVSLKSRRLNGTLHEDLCTFVIISRWIRFRTSCFRQTPQKN
jgi:hypothetical protein